MGVLRDRRRRRILDSPFPDKWSNIVGDQVAHWRCLSEPERETLRRRIQVFIAEVRWQGCGGLEITEQIQVTVAGEANLLLLGLDELEFSNVHEVLVYPSTVRTPEGPHARYGAVVESGSQLIDGQALDRGPVLLTWDSVCSDARHPDTGHNVVYHEFAHKLDMLAGGVSGTPPMSTRAQLDRWVATMTAEYHDVQRRVEAGVRSFLRPYAGVNVGEFFAVATEYFFDMSVEMRTQRPDLYGVLAGFYRQDPAARIERRHTDQAEQDIGEA